MTRKKCQLGKRDAKSLHGSLCHFEEAQVRVLGVLVPMLRSSAEKLDEKPSESTSNCFPRTKTHRTCTGDPLKGNGFSAGALRRFYSFCWRASNCGTSFCFSKCSMLRQAVSICVRQRKVNPHMAGHSQNLLFLFDRIPNHKCVFSEVLPVTP